MIYQKNDLNNIKIVSFKNSSLPLQKLSFHKNTNISDKISFSGASIKMNCVEKIKIRIQRKLFNHISEKNYKRTQNKSSLINNHVRERIIKKGKTAVSNYCKYKNAEFVASVKLTSKKNNSPIECYIVLRKINPDIDYSKLKSNSYTDAITNIMIHKKINGFKKSESILTKMLGFPKGHSVITKNSCIIEVLDNCGIPIGHNFVDINKDEIVSKGVMNFEPDSYVGVGRILNDTKSLIAHLNGSNKVSMPTTDNSNAFHIKCGYRIDKTKKPCGIGEWMCLPKDQLKQIVNKYKDSELYVGLSNSLKKLLQA